MRGFRLLGWQRTARVTRLCVKFVQFRIFVGDARSVEAGARRRVVPWFLGYSDRNEGEYRLALRVLRPVGWGCSFR